MPPTARDARRSPVIMLTARGDEDDRVMGLELGADDYVVEAVLAARADRAREGGACGAPSDGPSLVGPGAIRA